jgi:NADPH-dependent ferric siderophore reductase
VQRVRHELKIRAVEVADVRELGSHFRRITFRGEALRDFHSASFDDHVKFILGQGEDAVKRDYTPRSFDPVTGELCIEFALHGDGPVASWAAQAAPGQPVAIGGPRGSFIIPMDYDWHLLIGDESALPAISRRLEELPDHAPVLAIIKVADAADRRALVTGSTVDVRWVSSDAELIDAVRTLVLTEGEGYAWCAGEAATMAAVRKALVDEHGLGKHQIRAAAYWKRGGSNFHENLED